METYKYLARTISVGAEMQCYSYWKPIPATRDTIFAAIEKAEQIIKEDENMVETMIFELAAETDDMIVYEPRCRWIKPYYNKQVSFSADTYVTPPLTLMRGEYISFIIGEKNKYKEWLKD